MAKQSPKEIEIKIPSGLKPYFQEYDLADLQIKRDANLIIQRTLDFGTWEEIRWLFQVYGKKRIRVFLRQYGERWLTPVVFNYWRKVLKIQTWRRSPLPTFKSELWPH